MILLAPFAAPGRFYKGNMHTHSTRSDAVRDPLDVCALYRDAGYDFLALTDHFLPRYGFPITDTRPYRTNSFTTILGAEVYAPATELGEKWHILSVGLPLDFEPTAAPRPAPRWPRDPRRRRLCRDRAPRLVRADHRQRGEHCRRPCG